MTTLPVQVFIKSIEDTVNDVLVHIMQFAAPDYYGNPMTTPPFFYYVYGATDPSATPYAFFPDDVTAISYYSSAATSSLISTINAAAGVTLYTDASVAQISPEDVIAISNFVPNSTTVNGHILNSNITLTASDVGAPSGSGNSSGTNTGDQNLSAYVTSTSLISTLSSYATNTSLFSGLSGKFNTPAGTTSQYIRGDGSAATFPTVPTNVSAFTNDSGYVTAAGARSAISVTGNGSYNNSTGVVTINSPAAASFTNPTRTVGTAFQISSTRNAIVNYSIPVTSAATLLAGSQASAILKYADDSGMTTNVVTLPTAQFGATSGLVVTAVGTLGLSGVIPAGKYVEITTSNISGTPTYGAVTAQEVLL